jgi:hypothetical protein
MFCFGTVSRIAGHTLSDNRTLQRLKNAFACRMREKISFLKNGETGGREGLYAPQVFKPAKRQIKMPALRWHDDLLREARSSATGGGRAPHKLNSRSLPAMRVFLRRLPWNCQRIQPSLTGFFGDGERVPGVKTPGYFRSVPLGRKGRCLARRRTRHAGRALSQKDYSRICQQFFPEFLRWLQSDP